VFRICHGRPPGLVGQTSLETAGLAGPRLAWCVARPYKWASVRIGDSRAFSLGVSVSGRWRAGRGDHRAPGHGPTTLGVEDQSVDSAGYGRDVATR